MMKILGNSERNKWCCFCKYWYDPSCSALTVHTGKNMYFVEKDAKCKCIKRNAEILAISTCGQFERKF